MRAYITIWKKIFGFIVLVLASFKCLAKDSTSASIILMVPPEGFQFNPQTAKSNAYQHKPTEKDFKQTALAEFNHMVETLRQNGVEVLTLHQDTTLPDAVYPNNWFSIHKNDNGKRILILYPMLTENRQREVNQDGLMSTLKKAKINIDNIIDLRNQKGQALEGTGSMILDKKNKIIYASLSVRTNALLINDVAKLLNYTPVIFNSVDQHNIPIYHTNILMSVADKYAIVCLDCIHDKVERENVIHSLKKTNKIIIAITQEQMKHLCGNVLELTNRKKESLLVMSQQAYEHFTSNQLTQLQQYSKILPINLETIETIGGGSARCMIAEIN